MAKIRIHELSKELNVDSEAVIAFLGGDVKPMSGIEDADAERVRRHFRKKEQAADPAEKKASAAPPKAAPKDAPEGDETAKKKKPVFIFRPENSAYNQNRASSAGSRAGAPAGGGAKT
ncbi:MAG: translation initiation factor IF-2 N-terminal domain-containing protein, partial [Lachnospiraceae bacterium]|nr:translation initiation factor IF-2 N-terminal domain-containing protein [Lachnospiraceae bacterium]